MQPTDDQEEMDKRLGTWRRSRAQTPATIRKYPPVSFWRVVGVVLLGFVAWSWLNGGPALGPAAPIQAGSGDVAGTNVPAPTVEKTIAGIVGAYAEQYSDAPNQMAAGAMRPARATALCQAIPSSLAIHRWIGRISTLSSNEQGKGVLVLRISNQMSIGTWNNVFSDYQDHTLISPDSPLFATVSSMNVGDLAWFSGTFFPSQNDCIEEQSLTMDGGMTNPTFTFRFISFGPLHPGAQ